MKKFFLFSAIVLLTVATLFTFRETLPSLAYSQTSLDLNTIEGNYSYDFTDQPQFYKSFVQVPEAKNDLAFANVLGSNDNNKRIEVDLTNQRLYAFEGNNKVYDFLVSTGKWGRTPTGEFRIWIKLRYTKMSGGSKELGTYYYLPNVPYTMFFANAQVPASRGFGIHGTYWHNNFGTPMSHGCINMKTEEVEKIFYWANPILPEGKSSVKATESNPGTPVIIYGKAP